MASALEIENVSYAYGNKTALQDVSFTAAAGSFTALLGPNGAGKSTLFSLLSCLFVPQAGTLSVMGYSLAKSPRAALAHMGIVFQQPTLDLDLTIKRNLYYFAALQGLSARKARARIEEALDRLDIRDRADEQVRKLNGGHRRRAELARALIHQPKVLLRDEPTVGLDAPSRRSITDHAHALADQGLCVLWATHLVDEVAPGDQVLVLHRGQVLAHERCDRLCGDEPLAERFRSLTGAAA
ncbi:ABC transporter ATP-binding protein [Phaeobacter italicus]|uniref:ABC transporter ATP-binding protein n=1 Tax=Phaeobacter italicus TaxID=481446 RepID=UPI00248EF1FF|nr:ABC transporter ATP-binding protein [Phaeobacter italicus]